jgi:sirohydrochlorin cobaltochelatase
MKGQALVLFAHGARDPRWSEPFERLCMMVQAKRPSLHVGLAFLDFLRPDLKTAVQAAVQQGANRIRIVPLFFGRGGHLRDDFPKQLEAVRSALPHARIEVTQAAGEADPVLEALAEFALAGIA